MDLTVANVLHCSKHVFVPNFANMECGYVEATPDNKHLIESCYEARTEKELPVLVQYIDRNKLPAPKATHLDIILYSREQITKENEAMGNPVRLTIVSGVMLGLTVQLPLPRSRSPLRRGESSA